MWFDKNNTSLIGRNLNLRNIEHYFINKRGTFFDMCVQQYENPQEKELLITADQISLYSVYSTINIQQFFQYACISSK